ncbi:hypothetical protein KBC03_08005 [Patescibacteria group bacterium]|nr:hypothetical protein [Patescibacteria group bacterium]
MPVFPRTTYESLDDKEIVLSGDIFSVIEISRYQKAIEEILLLPQDMITLGKHPSLREKRDITEELSKQLLISGTIEDKR